MPVSNEKVPSKVRHHRVSAPAENRRLIFAPRQTPVDGQQRTRPLYTVRFAHTFSVIGHQVRDPKPLSLSADPASQYPQQEVRSSDFPAVDTPTTSEFGVNNPSSARSAQANPAYARQQYVQQQRHASTVSMAQATSPSMSLQDGHQNNHHNASHVKSNPEVPIDPSIAASSPTYPPYSPYAQQGHDMSQYQGHPPPGYQHWPQQYTGHPHGMPNGPYNSAGTAAAAAGAAATAGPRPGQVRLMPLRSKGSILLIVAESSCAFSGILFRANPGISAAQATPSPL